VSKPLSGKLNRHFVLDRWFEVLKNEPPRMVDAPILHHYTNAFGVQGIVSSNSLWATATQFSNDLSEIEYAVSIATEVIEERWGHQKRVSAWEKVLAQHLVQLFHTPLHSFGQPFIVSFCAARARQGIKARTGGRRVSSLRRERPSNRGRVPDIFHNLSGPRQYTSCCFPCSNS